MSPANKKVRFRRAFLLAFGGKLMRTHEKVSLNRSLQAGGERRLPGMSKQTRSAKRKRSQSSAPAIQDKDAEKRLIYINNLTKSVLGISNEAFGRASYGLFPKKFLILQQFINI